MVGLPLSLDQFLACYTAWMPGVHFVSSKVNSSVVLDPSFLSSCLCFHFPEVSQTILKDFMFFFFGWVSKKLFILLLLIDSLDNIEFKV